MPIVVHCPNPDCDKSFRVKDEYAGKAVKCPGCGGRIIVPSAAPLLSLDDDPVEKPAPTKRTATKQENRASTAKQNPAPRKAAPKRTIIIVEQPAPWNPTKIFLVILIGVFLFPPFHTRSIVYHTKRNPINVVFDRHTSFIGQPPGPTEGGFALIEERIERSILISPYGGLQFPWEIYWGRLFIEMGAAALLAVLFTGRRRKWFAIGAGVLLATGATALLLEDPPPNVRIERNDQKYEPPVEKPLVNPPPSVDPELEGMWVRTSVKYDTDAKGPAIVAPKYLMRIRGRDITVELEVEGKTLTAEYLLDVELTKNPRTFMQRLLHSPEGLPRIVDQSKSSNAATQIRALADFKIAKGIYSVDGNTLRLCFQRDEQLPEDFTIQPDSYKGRVIYEFERFVPGSAQKQPKIELVKPKAEPKTDPVKPKDEKVEPVKPKEEPKVEPVKPKEDPLEPLLKNPPSLESIDFFPEAEPKALPDEIRMAWYRAGATCGWLGLLESLYESDFALIKWPAPTYQVPAFWLDRYRFATPIASLPAPQERFGLYLTGAFDKATARELARFKHLDWLRLSSASTGSLVELVRCPALRSLELLNANDSHLKELARLKQLRCVALVGREITDAGVDSLLELPHLEALSINGAMTDAGLRKLAGCKQLRWLRLTGFHFTDAGLAVLLQLPKLQHVQIIGHEITEAGLRFAAHLPELRRVGYRVGHGVEKFSDDAFIKAERIRELGKLDQLRWLQIRQPKIDAIPEIGALTQLRGLNLDRIVLKPDWKPLGKLTNLETLTLPYGGEADEALAEVGRLKKLHSLTVRGGRVTSKGLAHLAGLTNLRSLDLEYALISDADLKNLETLKQLRSLNLQVTKISDAGLKSLAQLPELETLNLTSTSVADAGIGELAALRNLRTLSVLGTKVSQAGVKKLAGLEHLLIYYDNRPIEPDVGKPKTDSNSNPESKTDPAPLGEYWQKDPTAFAGLFFGGNLKKRTPDEARDLKYPKDVEKKVAGATIEWTGKVLPGPVSGGKNGNVLVVSAGQDGTILIRGSSGYKDGDKFVTIEEQLKSLPILTRVKIAMKIKTPINALIAFDGGPMLVLDGEDARVTVVK